VHHHHNSQKQHFMTAVDYQEKLVNWKKMEISQNVQSSINTLLWWYHLSEQTTWNVHSFPGPFQIGMDFNSVNSKNLLSQFNVRVADQWPLQAPASKTSTPYGFASLLLIKPSHIHIRLSITLLLSNLFILGSYFIGFTGSS